MSGGILHFFKQSLLWAEFQTALVPAGPMRALSFEVYAIILASQNPHSPKMNLFYYWFASVSDVSVKDYVGGWMNVPGPGGRR